MKPLDASTLFNLFEASDEQVYEEHGVKETLKNPYVLMGMVVRGVENYHTLDKIYLTNHKKAYEEVRDSIKYKYFSKMYTYLTKINYESFETQYQITQSFDDEMSNYGLNYMLRYFEDLEEYEKCVIIKKYIDLLVNQEIFH